MKHLTRILGRFWNNAWPIPVTLERQSHCPRAPERLSRAEITRLFAAELGYHTNRTTP
ncbi:hypothetical protein [Oceaniglobus ichthyenteri]|uniref:hypothetical protein n=1 Tax=Oceaniglobus ichthyenteri TaxID=2136177 RepID=UPI0013DDF3E6|nr:hypothetical protein [Oceaniglobus ichthyenteri]